jgi:DNA replication protein DnaC
MELTIEQRVSALYSGHGMDLDRALDEYHDLCTQSDDVARRGVPAWAVQALRANAVGANLPRRYRSASLSDFKTPTRAHEQLLEQVEQFVDGWLSGERKGKLGLLFWGQVGTGKTWAMACIAKAFIDHGVSSFWRSTTNFLHEIKIAINDNDQPDPFQQAAHTPVLFFDDLGHERLTDWADEQISAVLGQRYNELLPTFITTNLAPQGLIENSISPLEERIGSRVYSRLRETMRFVGPFPQYDWRANPKGVL